MTVITTRPLPLPTAWKIGTCPVCGSTTWTVPVVRKATGFGYLPTGRVCEDCDSCSYERIVRPRTV